MAVRVRFQAAKFRNALKRKLEPEQTRRLIEYAKEKIIELGDKIQAYNSANNMDRTGNLLDSLCWGVIYKGKLKGSGFYRQERATDNSYLHEWFDDDTSSLFPVDGRLRAQNFIAKFSKGGGNYWKVFFAICAPYWGYWESGFRLKTGFGGGTRFARWSMMTELYDEVRMDLRPAKVHITVGVPKYDYQSRKYKKKGYTKIRTLADRLRGNPYAERKWFSKYPARGRRR